jgi:type IV pilus assembly protein PilC
MNRFSYRVFDEKQNRVEGEVEARDINQAAAVLRGKGFLILSLIESKPDPVSEAVMNFQKPSLEDVSNFTRQLSTMITAGLPLVEALTILRDQSKPAMARVVDRVAQDVEGGVSLAEAMKKHEGVFTGVYTALIQAGEAAGVLDRILKKMADVLEKQRQFRNKTKGALVYPVIIVVLMVVVATLMMIFVIPKMTTMYKDFGAELPLPTRILIGISDFMVNFWPLLIVMVFVAYVTISRWVKTEIGGLIVERYMFRMPILGPLKKAMILTEFARTMGLLAAAGISILDALRIVSETMGSRIYRDGVLGAADRVEKGMSLAESLAQTTEFPPILGQMIAVGEQTGKVDETLLKLSDFYEEESETKVKALTTAIEPLIMIVMGIGVGFLVFAVITPIYNLTSQF